MNSQDCEHYTNSLCQAIGTAALLYFYWSHLPEARRAELRRLARAMVEELRARTREPRVTLAGAKWLEKLWQRSA